MGRNRRRRSAGKARFAHWREQQERQHASQVIREVADPLVTLGAESRYIPVRHGSEAMATLTVPRDAEPMDAVEQLELEFHQEPDTETIEPVERPLERDGFPITTGSADDSGAAMALPVVRSEADHLAPAGEPETVAASDPAVVEPIIVVRRRRAPEPRPVAVAEGFSMKRFGGGCLIGAGAAAAVLIAARFLFA